MQTLRLLLVAALAIVVVQVVPTPWALHIGGESTPFGYWSGVGAVHASNGGQYVLFIEFRGGIIGEGSRPSCSGRGCDNMFGTARMCTESGRIYTFKLRGIVHGWWTTDGSRTTVSLTGGTPDRLPPGWVVAFHGVWDGPVLSLESPDNSFTEIFTPAGAIRRVTSTADSGTARLTLRPRQEADFTSACRELPAAH
jgi:hypothetical protein